MGMELGDVLGQAQSSKDAEQESRDNLKAMRVAQLRREITELKSTVGDLQNELSTTRQLAEMKVEPVTIKTPEKNAPDEVTAVLVVSDNHAYEVVKKAEVNGLNEHNVSICRARMEKMFQKAVQLTKIERGAAKVKRLILALLGDHLTNQMHMDQVETNEGTPMEEILFLAEVFTGGIDYLLDEGGFDEILVPCCDGNHGRNTIKQQHANRVKHSYEWLLFNLLARHYAKDKRVKFDIAEGQLLYTEIYGRTVRWTHGDAIRYNGGIGGLTIPARKALKEWDSGRKADFTVFGHYHTSHLDKMFLSNGCSIGYGPYSVRIKAGYEPPQQSMLFLSPKFWLSAYRPIYL